MDAYLRGVYRVDVNIKWPMDRESAVDYLVRLIRGNGSLEEYRAGIYDKSELFLGMVREIVVGKYLADLVTSTRIEHRRRVNNFRVRIYGKPLIEYIKNPLHQASH